MKNEKGVIFPITVLFSFLFLSLFFHVLKLYETEVELTKYEQQSYDVDSLMQMAVTDVKAQMAANVPANSAGKGTFAYPNGNAQYEWKQFTSNEIKVTVTVVSYEGIRYSAEFTISFPAMELIEWKEKY
ncbi:competence protein ComGG [Anoxybacillus tepidamans]|uniref:Competence protein ComGG n=1 Tax=Anoxybacteroides tepidamans TaxID=265948 RepID=A0A7W8MWD0_9BACL|nr:competence type IV pilus minor pilin ComGG [Anoxybacillus tepidamans]MBB5325226.1 competence protein ComGG [Anoxybacillus tepidamans]